MSRPRVILVLVAAALAHVGPAGASLCDNRYCECNPAAHPTWTLIHCNMTYYENLDLKEGDVPEMTSELNITGANNVVFVHNSLSRLKDIRVLQIVGVRSIIIRKYAAMSLNAVSLYLDVQDCEFLRIEENAFYYLKGPLSATIANCEVVSIDSEAFSWLLSISILNVSELQLGPGSFTLDPTAANIGLHGPSLAIELVNVSASVFPKQAFGSSAASIMLKNVMVGDIMPEAFTANTYNRFKVYGSRFYYIHEGAFDQKTVIHLFLLNNSSITRFASGAIQSAVAVLNITESKFEHVETGAINATVASVYITDSEFINFEERGLELSSSNKIIMRRNKFDELPPNAIIAVGSFVNEVIFTENEIESMSENSLAFIGQTRHFAPNNVIYLRNYYGKPCYCNISKWLGDALGSDSGTPFHKQSFCTINEFMGRCLKELDRNVLVSKYIEEVCINPAFYCSSTSVGFESERVEIKNSRFPHNNTVKSTYDDLSERDKKIIGIVIVTALVCVIVAMLISLIKWMNRNGYCTTAKQFLISCGKFCNRMCCGLNRGNDTARSISQLSIHEYSERHRLNEIMVFQESPVSNMYEMDVLVEDKMTQTLPEELTKELLENLKDQLDDPDNYKNAREMIEHLYELIKDEEVNNTPIHKYGEENFYELPIINTMPRIGKNKKNLVSIGTKVPSLEKLMPLSPYNRSTGLVHGYFEPKDLKEIAVHLYAEITNDNPSLRSKADVVARGPYLNAIRGKISNSQSTSKFANSSGVPTSKSTSNPILLSSPAHLSTIKSNKSIKSNSSGHMINRPLPEKPSTFDAGEGSSGSR